MRAATSRKEAERQAEEQLNKIRCCNINISDCTFTGLAYEADQISKTGHGALCIKLTEFGDMVDAAISGDANSKELLGKLKDIADGAIEPKIIAGGSKEKYIYMYQSLSGGYIPNGWYINPGMPQFASGEYASQWNADPKVLRDQILNSKSSLRYRELLYFVGGLVADEMKVAWNDGEAVDV